MGKGMSKLLGSGVLAIAIIVAAIVGGNALMHRNDRPKTVSVKGGADRDFVSDLVVWEVTVNSLSATPLEGLRDVERQRKLLRTFLLNKGIAEEELVFGGVTYVENVTGYYDTNQSRYVEIKNGYNVSQTATVTSAKVDEVEKVARAVGELIEQNVTAHAATPRYYYTKLADLKLEMVAAAASDARERALQIAKESKGKLGGLRKSAMGVFQIVGRHSEEDYSWGGNFNTSSKEKTVSVTVTSEFLIK